jgi:hypothetical protein
MESSVLTSPGGRHCHRLSAEALPLPLSTLQLPLDGFANEVRSVLTIGANSVYAVESALGEASHHVFAPHFFASHRLFLI